MEEKTFEEEISEIRAERHRTESRERRLKEVRGEYIYTDFCVWLHCQGQAELRNNEKAFADWLKRENRTLTEYQRRWIAEKYFGWQVTWNKQKNEWESRKV